ncbi:hypothetical protein GMA11_00880 [Granulicatella sp. zg-ZJ]|uniref:hypothetical protein n=1 Tax=Granulicatella sp. zg-ZJ TaxID=2678504 RepID=UPI0013D8339D|nr:hypothetical protein [Granulicatella sp. zg-ZJ]MBS4749791.1 hypothetical protein [Carnobacteriaceae bacterium zg-ZUI78]NEW61937.1 hypothetical protein [Granulicatella sp. zg-ZJ]
MEMGILKNTFKMRRDVLVLYAFFSVILLLLCLVCQYIKAFFSTYPSISFMFLFVQLVSIGLIVAMWYIAVRQHQKTGVFEFYELGIKNSKTEETYFYHDIINYSFIPQTNKQAKALVFETDQHEQVILSAMLPPQAFELFQEDHTAVWKSFVQEELENGEMFSVDLYEDVTSFKMSLTPTQEHELVISKEGIVLHDVFYEWNTLNWYDVSWHGMLAIQTKEYKVIFLEPMTSISRYFLFISILDEFLPSKVG